MHDAIYIYAFVTVLPRGDSFLLHRPFQARSRGCVQTKTSEGGRIKMSADYNYFAPTGGRYQTIFRGTLPRRYSIRRSQSGNTVTNGISTTHCRAFT